MCFCHLNHVHHLSSIAIPYLTPLTPSLSFFFFFYLFFVHCQTPSYTICFLRWIIHSFAIVVAVAAATSTSVLTLITYVAFSYVYHTYTHTQIVCRLLIFLRGTKLCHFSSFLFVSFRTRHSSRFVAFSVSYYSCKSREEKFAAFAFNLRWVIYVHTLVYTGGLVANERAHTHT